MSKKQHQTNRINGLFSGLDDFQELVYETPGQNSLKDAGANRWIDSSGNARPIYSQELNPRQDHYGFKGQKQTNDTAAHPNQIVHEQASLQQPTAFAWHWEVDHNGIYRACGSDIFAGTGFSPSDFLGQQIRTCHLAPQSVPVITALLEHGEYPDEADVFFFHKEGHPIGVRITLNAKNDDGWHGFAQTIPISIPAAAEPPTRPVNWIYSRSQPGNAQETVPDPVTGRNPEQPLTNAGAASLNKKEPIFQSSTSSTQATLAVPVKAGQMGDLLLEVVDEHPNREWSEDDRAVVTEVANQLALALENARLYSAAQQELADRIRAEEAILHRNRDLALLNQLGQKLSTISTQNEIYNTLSDLVGQILDNRNLVLCTLNKHNRTVSFPVYRVDGKPAAIPTRPVSNELAEYAINLTEPLLLTSGVGKFLTDNGIAYSERHPLSLIAIPMRSSDHHRGAMLVQNFDQEQAPEYDGIHLELLSTAATQAATSLENAYLFEQMQEALHSIEKRERYQGGVAQSAASLSENGTQALPLVLKHLGHASQASRVYLMVRRDDRLDENWSLVEDWTSPTVAYLFDRAKIQKVGSEIFEEIIDTIRTNGWIEIRADEAATPAGKFLTHQNIKNALVINVPSKGEISGLLVFDQIDYRRQWMQDEINILRVAADAIANTYVREQLLEQLQANLDETESLYTASNRLVVANDYQEMIAAVIAGMRTSGINRGVMALFEYDNFGKISRITVQGNWYNGYGTPPPPVGTEYPTAIYEKLLYGSSQVFIDDLASSAIEDPLRNDFVQQRIRSLAILPMVSGKRHIGSFMVLSESPHIFSASEKRTLPPLIDQLTTSVENLRLFEQTQTALAETALLYNMGSAIAQAQSPEEMVAQVALNGLPRGAEQAMLMLIQHSDNGEISHLEITGHTNLHNGGSLSGTRLNFSDLPVIRAISDEGLSLSDTNSADLDETSRQTFSRLGIGSITFIPLRSGGSLVGLLAAASQAQLVYEPDDIRLLRTLGNSIAVTLEKLRLLRQAERRALELQTASEIARDTTSTLALDQLLNRIVNLLVTRFSYASASLFFTDPNHKTAHLRETAGQSSETIKKSGYSIPVTPHSVVGAAITHGEPVILNDVSASALYHPHPLYPETRAEMVLPLRIGNRITGVLDIRSNQTGVFSADDVNVLNILTDQIAIAIENARAYELSQQAVEDMREVDRVKSQFLANMSHELRTPLNSIIGFSRVILKGIDGPVSDMQQQDLTAIYNSGQHLLMLINDILDLSKIEAGKMELAFSDINLADLINSSMSTATGLVKDKPIHLRADIQENLPLVRADSTRIRQVLINFLSNAAKFTEEGSIEIRAYQAEDPSGRPEAMVTVTDTGPGISEADQVKLFLPFSQVDDSATRKSGGTGLGLSICRSLIDLHGGRIGLLNSTPGKGSTFFFALPLSEKALTAPEEPPLPNPGSVILSIDDDPQVISLYQRYLQPQGYTIIAHTNPHTAVETARKHKPVAITLDLMMPERDGWQVMQDLNNDPETRAIPIIICSILEEEEKGINLGAADYLVKPFLQEDLLNTINRLKRSGKIQSVLVVDDDEEDLRLVQKMLEQGMNLSVSLAHGGVEGWAVLLKSKPDVVVLDLVMPDLDGFSILAKMRANAELRDIPVVILSGADLTPEQHRQLDESGKLLLSKSLLREKELLTTLEYSLNRLRASAAVN